MSRLATGSAPLPRRQEGIAIVSVLMVLAAVMLLGVTTMMLTNSNLMIAENQVTATIARSHAEGGIDAVVAALAAYFEQNGSLPASAPSVPNVTGLGAALAIEPAPTQNGQEWYTLIGSDRVALRVLGRGPRDAEYVAEALVEFAAPGGGGGSPYRGAVVACESISLRGSGRIDSFDSAVPPYTYVQNNPGSAGHVLTLSTDGTVSLEGHAPIYGDVNSTGGVLVTGSSPIYGDINANGLVDLRASQTYHGNVRTLGDVRFGDATVAGDVLANGNVNFTKWNPKVLGSVQVGGTVTFTAPQNTHVPSGNIRYQHPGVLPVAEEDCDPLGVSSMGDWFSHVPSIGAMPAKTGTYLEWNLSPTGAQRRLRNGSWEDAGTPTPVNVLGTTSQVYRVSGVDMANDSTIRVTGDVVLFVDGNFSAKGDPVLIIDEDSSLTVFVTGTTLMDNSFRVAKSRTYGDWNLLPVNSRGIPTFSIYSSYSGANGVTVRGNGKVNASIYAPHTDVLLQGSGENFGALRARNIVNTGSGAMHYDEALGRIDIGGGDPTAGEMSVTILSRR